MKKINKENLITCIIILLFILILAPMIYISKYNYPSSDDYTYGIEICSETCYNMVRRNKHKLENNNKNQGMEDIWIREFWRLARKIRI